MALPTTPLRSAFSGGAENPLSESGAWGGATEPIPSIQDAVLQRVASPDGAKSAGTAGQTAISYWAQQTHGPHWEAWAKLGTIPGVGSSVYLGIVTNIGVGTSDGYIVAFANTALNNCQIFKITNDAIDGGAPKSIQTVTQITTGCVISLQGMVVGSGLQITAQVDGASAVSWTDTSSPYTAAGNLVTGGNDTTFRLSEFGGGRVYYDVTTLTISSTVG